MTVSKICVSLTGRSPEELEKQLAAAAAADLAEWRADLMEKTALPRTVPEILGTIRAALPETPLILTYRTAAEGGQGSPNPGKARAVLEAGVRSGTVSYADIEWKGLFRQDPVFVRKLGKGVFGRPDGLRAEGGRRSETGSPEDDARRRKGEIKIENKVGLIFSWHDFQRTPPAGDLAAMLKAMEADGASVAKIAVMARDAGDAETVREAAGAARSLLRIPFVLIAMGEAGRETRLRASELGSWLTFGALPGTGGSAPGQPDLRELLAAREKQG